MNWVNCKLGEVLQLHYGKSLPERERTNGDIPVYGSGGIGSYHEKALVEGPGVIVGRKGTIGSVYFEKNAFFPIDTVYYVVPTKAKIELRFAYYLLNWLPLNSLNGDAAVPGLNRERALSLEISLPTINEQKKIANILSTFDELIENNLRRIALLEESARLLYREWFVHFRFLGYEHTQFIDDVPEGWVKKTLNELTSFLKRGITPDYDDDAKCLAVNQKCIRDGRLNLMLARRQSKEVKHERYLQFGDVLVNSTGEGTLGRVAQVKTHLNNCTVDTHVTIVRPKKEVGVHYFGQSIMEWESRFTRMGKGSTNQTELSPATIGETSILMPSNSLVERFELFATPIYEQITNLVAQNEKLVSARDLLLPRLMSGEITV